MIAKRLEPTDVERQEIFNLRQKLRQQTIKRVPLDQTAIDRLEYLTRKYNYVDEIPIEEVDG